MKLFILFITYILLSFSAYSQTLEIGGKQIIFGMSEEDLAGTFWQDGGQIKSDYPYINLYEGTNSDYFINGSFYDGKLVLVNIGGEDIFRIEEI